MKQSESDAIEDSNAPSRVRAIAYYRQSTEHQRADSITNQQVQVREWATKNGVEIIREFSDVEKSGNASEERSAFDEMMENWVTKRMDFAYILCLDASRLGRFQDKLSTQLIDQCKTHRKLVICTIGKSLGDDPL